MAAPVYFPADPKIGQKLIAARTAHGHDGERPFHLRERQAEVAR